MEKENAILIKSFDFALAIISLNQKMIVQKEYVLSRQLLRSATSIGANVEEAMAGISKKDFIAKMSIASKEARESKYWLRLIKHSDLLNLNVDDLIDQTDELIRILTAIVKTSQSKP